MGMTIKDLLKYTSDNDASDLHISVGHTPMVRLNGKLCAVPDQEDLTREEMQAHLRAILTNEQFEKFQAMKDFDMSYELDGVARYRVNVFVQRRGEAAAFRLIPTRIRKLEELGMPSHLYSLTRLSQGFILVTGPTGSGKTTTLAALLDHANATRHDHIITVEDPIEYVIDHQNCIVDQREVGAHTASFHAALRSSLREDPDIILVGEMRDLETISLALTAAETGHLVFATLHTNSCAETIDRIVDVFPSNQQQQVRTQLAGTIAAVISQRLVVRADGKGRVPAYEIMMGTSGIRALIREGKSEQIQSLIQTGGSISMNTLDACLKRLANEGVITQDEAYRHALNKAAVAPSLAAAAGIEPPKRR